MAVPQRHALTINQTADGDNNNTSNNKEGGVGPIIDANGWYTLDGEFRRHRFDVIAKGTSSPDFTVQVYGEDIDGDEIPLGDAVSDWTVPNQVIFQGPTTWNRVKLKVSSYVAGTLNASIQYV